MGVNTWAAFAGSDDKAVVDGDFAMLESELQPVLKALRAGGIDVVAIHNHMTGESPRIMFLHYWGVGPTETLAADAPRRARQDQAPSARAVSSAGASEPAVPAGKGTGTLGDVPAVLPAPRHARLRRPDRARRLHAARPRRDARGWISKQDYKEGLALAQLAPGPLAAQLAIYLGWAARRRPRRHAGRASPSSCRRSSWCSALSALYVALRRPALDAGRVLRHRRRGHRHHRAQRLQAREDDARARTACCGRSSR